MGSQCTFSSARSRLTWSRYKGLNAEQAIVYSIIDDAGAEGMWTKTIKARSNLADTSLTAVFKHLLHKKLIADMKSVAYPQRKMYIKASVRPSDTASGGPFYTDGELDDAFIEAIADALYNYIFSRSFYQSSTGRSRKPMKKPTSRKSMGEAQAYREGADEVAIKLEDEPSEQQIKQQRLDAMYPMPAGYQKYPTLRDLATFIDKAGITNTVLGLEDIQQLLDVLVWDNRIEAVLAGPDGVSYRALRMTADEMEDGPTNGLTQAPCGNCPVFDICEEGGPVAPSNCEYFKRWLDPDGY